MQYYIYYYYFLKITTMEMELVQPRKEKRKGQKGKW
jgi:hypothetical protein